MSSVVGPAAGGSFTDKQPGTAPAVSGGACDASQTTTDAAGMQQIGLSIPPVSTENPVEEKGNSDLDSLFGGDVDLEAAAKENTLNIGGIAHSDGCANKVTPADLTLPTVGPAQGNGTVYASNMQQSNFSDLFGSLPNGSNSVSPTPALEATPELAFSQTTAQSSVIDPLSPAPGNEDVLQNSENQPNAVSFKVPTDGSATANCDQDGILGALAEGTVPKPTISSAVLFGPELQKALFAGGEASSDPQLPTSGVSIPGPQAASGSETQLGHAAPSAPKEDVAVPSTPTRPPTSPPRLANIPVTRPASPGSRSPFDAPGAGANPNRCPEEAETPLADKLRADFWEWHRKEKQLLHAYKKSYAAWAVFTAKAENKAKGDHDDATAEGLKTRAIDDQVAWARHSRLFEQWKADNPAVALIVNNVLEEMRLVRAGEKLKAERVELMQELRGKPDAEKRSELARYDNFVDLMRQSRERELWRNRVETQKAVQAILEAEVRAIEEQERIRAAAAAEEQRKREEAEAAERTRLEQARLAAEEAEKEREKAAAEAAENARRAAEAEAARNANAAASLGQVQQEVVNQDFPAMAAFDNTNAGNAGDVQDFQF